MNNKTYEKWMIIRKTLDAAIFIVKRILAGDKTSKNNLSSCFILPPHSFPNVPNLKYMVRDGISNECVRERGKCWKLILL